MLRNKKKNDIHMDKYNGVGGKLESGESPYDCAVREIKEETGYTATSLHLRGQITFPKFEGQNDWHVFIYVVDAWEGDKIFLPRVFKDKFFTAKFNYENKKLTSYCFY